MGGADGERLLEVHTVIILDAFGDPLIQVDVSDPKGPASKPLGPFPPEAAERFASMLMATAAAARIRAAMYRRLSLAGWSHDDAITFINEHVTTRED